MAYADVLVTAEVNSCIRCNFRCFATVSGKIPTLVGSFFYSVQLAYVYSVSIGSTCCYAADLAVCSNSHLTQLSACGGDLAVVAACIAYVQLAVTQCGITGIYAVFQYYVADFTCSCDYFAVFIYGEVVVCCVECAGAVYKERHNSVFCHSTYGQVVFCVQGVGLDGVYINVFVQLNLNFSAVMAYADVLVTAEANILAGFYVGCFGCNTVGIQIPTCISSVAYFLQLAYVYCVGTFSACCYIDNLTVSASAAYGYCISSVSYTANAQGNTAFNRYRSTVADSNCITSRNRILMTEGNNIAYASDCVFVAHYNGIGNIVQCIVGACHEYIMADIFLTTDKPVIIADNGRIGLFGNSVGTADYCYSTALLFSENRIVTAKNS